MNILGFVLLALIIYWIYQRQQQKKLKGKETLKPIRIITNLSIDKVKDLISQHLPDNIHKTHDLLGDPLGKNNGLICQVKSDEKSKNILEFGIVGYGGILGTINLTALDGSIKNCIVSFSIVVSPSKNFQGKTEVYLITKKWTQKSGVFEKFQQLIRVQNKFANILTKEDPQAEISKVAFNN